MMSFYSKHKTLVIILVFASFINIYSKNENNSIIIYEKFCSLAETTTNSDSIIHYSNLALDIALKEELIPSRAYILLGNGYYHSGKLTLSLENYFNAARLYETNENSIGLATCYTNISNIYIIQQNYGNANYYNQQAIKLLKDANDSLRLAHALHNFAYNLFQQDKMDSSILIYTESKILYQELNMEYRSAYCLGNMGLVFSKQKKFVKAESYLKSAIKNLKKYNDTYGITDFTLEYSKILQQKGQIDSAIHYGLNCYNISVENNISERIRDASKCLADFYNEKDQYDSAYYYQVIFTNYSDSLKNIETVQKMADLRTTYEVSQKQAEVDLLEKQKKLYYILIGSLFLAVILGAGLIALYYRNLKRVKEFSNVLKTQSNKLKETNAIKDKFFSIISHDLRSPISSLAAISMMIDESLEHGNKSILHEASDYIDKTVYSLTGLLDNLLNWAISQQGQFPFHPEKINTKKLINEEVRLLTTIAISKEIKLLLDLRESLFIVADPNSFKTIIRNLLSNAYKFTPKKGEVIIRSKFNANNQVIIEISDNGIGIAQDKLDKLFKLNAYKSTYGTEQEKGLGLGLSLIYEFVQKNKGQIAVQSQEGKGTTFTLSFSIADAE